MGRHGRLSAEEREDAMRWRREGVGQPGMAAGALGGV